MMSHGTSVLDQLILGLASKPIKVPLVFQQQSRCGNVSRSIVNK